MSVKDGSPRNMCRKSGSDIKVSSISDTGYWEGSIGEREGWFPSEQVQEVRLRQKGGYCLLTMQIMEVLV